VPKKNKSKASSHSRRHYGTTNIKRAKNYVSRSPQCSGLSECQKERLIRGIARMLYERYWQGYNDMKKETELVNKTEVVK